MQEHRKSLGTNVLGFGNDSNVQAMKTYVTGLQYKPGGVMVFRTIGLDH